MLQQIYRFQILAETGRAGSNVVLHARDSGNGSSMLLCSWTPHPTEFSSARDRLATLIQGFDGSGLELFSSSPGLYLAGPDNAAITRVLGILQSEGIFSGSWPGLIEEPRREPVRGWEQSPLPPPLAVVPPDNSQSRSTRKGTRAAWTGFVLLILIVGGVSVSHTLAQRQEREAREEAARDQRQAEVVREKERADQEAEQKRQAKEQSKKALGGSTQDARMQRVPSDILSVLDRWRQSMLSGDAEAQTNCYAPTVEVYFRRKNVNREVLRDWKRSGMAEYPNAGTYELSEIQLESKEDDLAIITFRKSWDFTGTKHFSGEEKQRLTFAKIEGDWKILREEELQIYWVKKQ